MTPKLAVLLVTAVTLTFSTVGASYIHNTYPEDTFDDSQNYQEDDFEDEPVYQPRFLPIFQDTASMGKVVQALQNPGNKTLQDELINIVADLALKNFGGDETIKKVIEVVKSRGNKTFQDVLMNVAAEVALIKFKGDETIKSVAEILKNPNDAALQQKLLALVADVADSKLTKDGTLKKVAEVLNKPGNRTLQENLLNAVVEVAVSKFGNEELIRKISEVFQNSGNKTVQENLLNLATNVALIKYGNNPIVKLVAEVIQNNGNLTIEERLSTAADAALNGALGPVQAAIIKQGIGIAGQALKVGGSMLGGTLTNIGGDSILGKAGQALTNGSQTVGGFMSKFGGGDKGVGLAIEKFGDAMKGENASIQEAFMKAGNVLSGQDLDLTKEVEVLTNDAQTVGDEVNEVENAIESESSAIAAIKEESDTDVVVPSVVEEVVENLVAKAPTSTEEIGVVENLQEVLKTQVEDTPEVPKDYQVPIVDSSVGLKVTKTVEDASKGKIPDSIGKNSEPLADIANSVGTSDIQVNTADRQFQQTVGEGQPMFANQIMSSSKTGSDNSGATGSYVSYPAQGTVVTQNSLSQGGNQNVGGALGSASAAIVAARHALEAGNEALGGALGQIAGGSGSTQGASGQGSPQMSVEITTVKLQMG